jgi:hypothetical protein
MTALFAGVGESGGHGLAWVLLGACCGWAILLSPFAYLGWVLLRGWLNRKVYANPPPEKPV